MKKIRVKFELSWAFQAKLAARQEELQRDIKPAIAEWAGATWPLLQATLRDDRKAQSSMRTDMLNLIIGDEALWVFVAMISNRGAIPGSSPGTDVVAMVAADETAANLLAQCWFEAARNTMGVPTKTYW